MAKFTIESRARSGISSLKVTPRHSKILFSTGESIHFYDGIPVAVDSHGVVYHHTTLNSGAITKLLNKINELAPHIREGAEEFDFIIGQVLVKAGLPLTRKATNESIDVG